MGGGIHTKLEKRDGQGLLISTFNVAQSEKPVEHEKVEFVDINPTLSRLTSSGFYC